MQKELSEVLYCYDKEVIKLYSEKYGYSYNDALKKFVTSETHKMMEDPECGMSEFGAPAILEIWEAEQITGDPRNSVYIRED